MVAHAEKGEVCDFGAGDPSGGQDWGPERTVRAEVIYALCCGTEADWTVHAKGVRVRGARIEGELDFEDSTVTCPLHLLSCYVRQPINLQRAHLRSLVLSRSRLHALIGDGLEARELRLDDGFSCVGEVRLPGATIEGDLDCSGGSFENRGGETLWADRLNCSGDVLLQKGFSAKGEVRLPGATIGGGLDCSGGRFENPEGKALFADGLDCKGDVFLAEDFSAEGEVRLLGATICGDLQCSGGRFAKENGDALSADRLDCKGGVYLRDGFRTKGGVRFPAATIGGNLDCQAGTFDHSEGTVLHLRSLTVKGTVLFRGLDARPKGEVNLMDASVGVFEDDNRSWPEQDRLVVQGLRYGRINPAGWEERTEWLRLAPYSPQPYDQLASVLQTQGQSEGAIRVLMEKQKDRIRRGQDGRLKRFVLRFLGLTVGYGHRPSRALWWLLVFWLVFGWPLFSAAGRHRIMAPTDTSVMSSDSWLKHRRIPPGYQDYPPFEPVLYSLDALLPIINLNMERYWGPSLAFSGPVLLGLPLSVWTWEYLRCHIAVGWILSTLGVLAFTGIVRPR